MNGLKRAARIFGTVLLALVIWALVAPDASAPDDKDLIPAAYTAGGDGFDDFLAMGKALDVSGDERAFLAKQTDSGLSDAVRVEDLLKRNAKALALFDSFSRRATVLDPNNADPSKVNYYTPVPQFFPLVAAARLVVLRSELLLARGQGGAALAQAMTAYRAGRLLASAPQPLISSLVGFLVMDLAAKRVRAAALAPSAPAADRRVAARLLAAPTGSIAGLQAGLRYEYVSAAWLADHIREAASQAAPGTALSPAAMRVGLGTSLFQKNRTKTLFSENSRRFVEAAAQPCAKVALPPFKPLAVFPRPNLVGVILYNVGTPDYSKLYVRRCTSDWRAAEAGLTLALAAYKADYGRWPVSLDVLTPKYVDAVPADPFTGAPIAYLPDTGAISSSGVDADGKPL